ncbi:MAG: Asp-tRNA(Asn)/Glu-tRNA(Gln) amidotransferase subunit GatC [Sphingomonadales bacterium]
MSVDKKTVKKIAHLARIALPEAKVAPMTEELNNILAFVEQLSGVDTENARPMTSAVETKLHWREDKISDDAKAGDILKNAPETESGFFAVPKVLE